MTEVQFHFNLADKVGYACRLLRKASAKGSRVVVTAESPFLQRLDVELWTFEALEFVPHCLAGAESAVLEASPIVLAASARETPHHEVLVNLGPRVPEGFERFERLIEVVGQDEEERVQGRTRWRHYADRGYALSRVDLANWEPR